MEVLAFHKHNSSIYSRKRRMQLNRIVFAVLTITYWTSAVVAGNDDGAHSFSSLNSSYFSQIGQFTGETLVTDEHSGPKDVVNNNTSAVVMNGNSVENNGNGHTLTNGTTGLPQLIPVNADRSTPLITYTSALPSPRVSVNISVNEDAVTVPFAVSGKVLSPTGFNFSSVVTSVGTNGSEMSQTATIVGTSVTVNSTPTAKTITEEDKKFKYYSYKIVNSEETFQKYWRKEDELKGGRPHEVLEKQYLTAVTVRLNFTFFFYGHEVDSVTVATGGFLYMSDFLHDRLTYSQYIAPLMANFGTEFLNQSHIHYIGNDGKSFTVWWENVTLKDYAAAGQFNFQATLFNTGRIAFAYDFLPVPISRISSQFHSVRVGLSDAYYFDEVTSAGYTERKISEYNRVTVDVTSVGNHSLVLIEPLPTCIQQKTCTDCLNAASTLPFTCQWCPQLKRCSDGFDRKRQQWLNYGCNTERITVLRGCYGNRVQLGYVTIVVIIIASVLAVGFWLCYAHMHPNSSSGRWLIEHRPRACLGKFCRMSCCPSPMRRERYVSYQSGLESLA